MNKTKAILRKLIAAYDYAAQNFPTWKEKREAEYKAFEVRKEAVEHLENTNDKPE